MKTSLGSLVMLGLFAARLVAGPDPLPAAVISDPPPNRAFPAAMEVAAITSHGSTMHGILYLASGAGPHPALLLMHGFPGNEQNLDLAQAVRRAGWNVLTFHYRGSWGSDGAFSFTHMFEDADAAVAFLRDPANARRFRIDPRRIVVAGHSMGGNAAAHAAAKDPTILAAALISPWNIGGDAAALKTPSDRAEALKGMADNMESLQGCSAGGLVDEMVAHQAEWNFIGYAPELKDRPLLITTADDGNTPDSEALLAAIRQAGGHEFTEVGFATDHSYSDTRIGLEAAFIRWLLPLGATNESTTSAVAPVAPAALAAPAAEQLIATVTASGAQIYECEARKDDPSQFEWVFQGPEADLFDSQGQKVGRHYAGPTWEWKDGSRVAGTVNGSVPSKNADAVPWLRLVAKAHAGAGMLSRVTSIQRLETRGGKAPNGGCSAADLGKKLRVPYTAVYCFYVPRT